ncbi:TylF/MycF/NovP-related O-methyltransferase [Hymenobacter convexus]|uniref:TylF/MycF/NovP-related O-methyltransferase n=1 Tax=Hymenobacter sp. CA1UV-4 TaxID=3063782 RepID=UPI00271442D4|nr:TylF/MycF/NovP-related O-methyltransferase [Hymenobacter sp. CA1UV-4]MDO7853448.1 TylF/MycF/NovP-related O-methyltransferase [Hymenobacter sp. CA1UV-4]
MSSPINVLSGAPVQEQTRRENFAQTLRESPIPNPELPNNLGLYLNRQTLSRLLFFTELYQQIIPVHGVAMEFGVRWGQNLALMHALRGIYEPFNYNRKIIGFDTFGGFPSVDAKDGDRVKAGDYGVTDNYQEYLTQILALHEQDSPIPHKRKFELVAGDASETVPRYLRDHPETVIAFAYFDFDIYAPTKACLEAIRPRLTKGAIVAFDELNCPEFPGETLAFDEVFGVANYALRRSPLNPLISYLVV